MILCKNDIVTLKQVKKALVSYANKKKNKFGNINDKMLIDKDDF